MHFGPSRTEAENLGQKSFCFVSSETFTLLAFLERLKGYSPPTTTPGKYLALFGLQIEVVFWNGGFAWTMVRGQLALRKECDAITTARDAKEDADQREDQKWQMTGSLHSMKKRHVCLSCCRHWITSQSAPNGEHISVASSKFWAVTI